MRYESDKKSRPIEIAAESSRPESADSRLVARIQAGDRDAANQFASTYGPSAFRLAFQLLGNQEDARDVTQDALMKFLASVDTFDAKRPVLPWLRRIVRNAAIDRIRRAKVRRADSLDTGGVEGDAIDVPTTRPGPHHLAQNAELKRRIWSALAKVSREHREILVLRDYQDLAYREIAETLDIPMGTVMSRLHAARKRLRGVLLDGGVDLAQVVREEDRI